MILKCDKNDVPLTIQSMFYERAFTGIGHTGGRAPLGPGWFFIQTFIPNISIKLSEAQMAEALSLPINEVWNRLIGGTSYTRELFIGEVAQERRLIEYVQHVLGNR